MTELHRAVFNGHVGYYNPRTGRVRFGKCIYSSIGAAIKYLKPK
jgi:hypothetical protein